MSKEGTSRQSRRGCLVPTTVASLATQRPGTFAPCASKGTKRMQRQWGCFHEDNGFGVMVY